MEKINCSLKKQQKWCDDFVASGDLLCVFFVRVVDWLDWLPAENGWVRRAGSSYLFFMNIYLLVHLSEADDRNYMWLGGRRSTKSLPWRRSQLEIPALRLMFDQRVCLLWQLLIKLCWAEWVFYVYTLRWTDALHIKILCLLMMRASEINWWWNQKNTIGISF